MHALFLVTAFLLVIASLVAGKISRGMNDSLITHLHSSYRKFESALVSEREASLLHEIKKQETEGPRQPRPPRPPAKVPSAPKSRSLDINLARPPDNAFLNVNNLEDAECYVTINKLLNKLYPHSPYPAIFLTALERKKERVATLNSLDELSAVIFESLEEQEAVCALLKGYIDSEGKPRPSFLNYARLFPKNKKINFLFAPEELLEVMIDHPDALSRALSTRRFYWKLILDQEEHRLERQKEECFNRTYLAENIEGDIDAIFKRYHLSSENFDFTLGQQGSFLIVTDPHTKMSVREKVSSQ